ncbi:uncharacterized protein LOC126294974 [Schistocerca gregaria]|uniref:uncharacterized protein LOC126294974 n=1 Tax=Schistocerca gregaria TaxID=7010 RepID=UPI00211E4013|nr:uncharacterized protein LOC126294974 [Schistocerca gregaria]XP_049843158.1 uncharacterized protein LOC126294974 [Schistocerca gregaria]
MVDVPITKKRKPEEDVDNPEMSNGDVKKLKSATDGGELPVQQKQKLNELESNESVSEEVSENGTGVSGQQKDEKLVSMRLAVVLEGFPNDKMTEEQAEVLETALIEKINPTEKGEPIQFSETQYENGGLVFTCVNKATKAWLHSIVSKISPWSGAKLRVGQAEVTLKGTKFVLWVMMGMNKRTNRQILDLFQKQNEDLSTSEWKIIRRVAESDKKERLTLWVDDKSSEHLKAHNFKLFLGLARPKFMLWAEWKKQMGSTTKRPDMRPAVRSLMGPPTSHSFLRLSRGSEFSAPNLRPRIPRFDRQNRPSRKELEFVNTGTPHFREAQFPASGRRSSRERTYTEHVVLQNRESRFPASGRPRERGFGMSERSQLRESGYVESDEPQENRYFASESRQPRETGYGASDTPRLSDIRFMGSDELSRSSRYTPPNRNQLEKLTFRDSYRARDSRLRDLDEPPFQDSRGRGPDQGQSRDGRFVERGNHNSSESRSRMFENVGSRMSRSWEDRFSDSDFPPQQLRSSYMNSARSRFSRPSQSSRAKW